MIVKTNIDLTELLPHIATEINFLNKKRIDLDSLDYDLFSKKDIAEEIKKSLPIVYPNVSQESLSLEEEADEEFFLKAVNELCQSAILKVSAEYGTTYVFEKKGKIYEITY